MSSCYEMFGRISRERLVSVDAKFSNARRGFPVFRTMFPRRAIRLAGWGYYIKNLGGRGALFADSVSIGCTERFMQEDGELPASGHYAYIAIYVFALRATTKHGGLPRGVPPLECRVVVLT